MSDFNLEHNLLKKGFKNICGIDEAGRGPFAGPVCAAAVILPIDVDIPYLDDSKKITSEKKRQALYEDVVKKAVDYGIAMVDNNEIEETDIVKATFKAMRLAVEKLKIKPDYLLIDGNLYRNFDDFEGECVIKGDAISMSISAASILAKVTRDNYMVEQAKKYPEYQFEKNKGYGGSKVHQQAILDHGICPLHRPSYLRKFYEKHNINKSTTLIGKKGEDLACEYLIKNGYDIIKRNYHSRYGEIDIIAQNEDVLAIIEVKTRKNLNFGQPCESVNIKKQQKIIKTTLMLLSEQEFQLQPRFDVIEICNESINHIKNAFEHN